MSKAHLLPAGESAFLCTFPLHLWSTVQVLPEGMGWHRAGESDHSQERGPRSLLPTPILCTLGHCAERDDVSANMHSLVQNIFPSCIVLANIVNLWVDFRPK